MVSKALTFIAQSDAHLALAISVACLLKMLAAEGLKPSFDTCISCGSPIDLLNLKGNVPISVAEGGIICSRCRRPSDTIPVESAAVSWAQALLYSQFDDIGDMKPDAGNVFAVLHLVRQWIRVHTGKDLKSIDFLLTSGLF